MKLTAKLQLNEVSNFYPLYLCLAWTSTSTYATSNTSKISQKILSLTTSYMFNSDLPRKRQHIICYRSNYFPLILNSCQLLVQGPVFALQDEQFLCTFFNNLILWFRQYTLKLADKLLPTSQSFWSKMLIIQS